MKKDSRGGKRPGAGRRSRHGTPMPGSAFTAHPKHLTFYLLLSGEQKTVSAGIQEAVGRLAKRDADAALRYEQANWIVNAAHAELTNETGVAPNLAAVWKRVNDNIDRFVAMWEERETTE